MYSESSFNALQCAGDHPLSKACQQRRTEPTFWLFLGAALLGDSYRGSNSAVCACDCMCSAAGGGGPALGPCCTVRVRLAVLQVCILSKSRLTHVIETPDVALSGHLWAEVDVPIMPGPPCQT